MLIQCSYSALTVLFYSHQDRQRSSLNSAHQYVNVTWTLEISCVRLACRSKVVCMEDMLLVWVCPWAQIYPVRDKAQFYLSWFKRWNKRHSADPTNWKGTPQMKSFSFTETKDGIVSLTNSSLKNWKLQIMTSFITTVNSIFQCSYNSHTVLI